MGRTLSLETYLERISTMTPEERKMIVELRTKDQWADMKLQDFKKAVKKFYGKQVRKR